MSEDMLRSNALRTVLSSQLAELAIRLTGPDREEWEKAFGKFIRRKNPWDQPRALVTPRAQYAMKLYGEFIVGNFFRPESHHQTFTLSGSGIHLRAVDERIVKLFPHEQVPASFEGTPLFRFELNFAVRGTPLRRALASHDPPQSHPVHLYHVYEALMRHSMAGLDKGFLLNPEGENLFFVRDRYGKSWTLMLWPVPTDIRAENTWDVNLCSASHSDRHRAGSYVFCH